MLSVVTGGMAGIQWSMWGTMPFTEEPSNATLTSPVNNHRGFFAVVAFDYSIEISIVYFDIVF